MSQYRKLFNKSEIEFITPFLKLWMSFNSWYKEDLGFETKDIDAINHYKSQGKIKDEFLKLFSDTSDLGIDFNIAIYDMVNNLRNYELKYSNGDRVKYKEDLIYENIDGRRLDPIYISETKKRFQISSTKKEDLFNQSLDIIYQVRSSLVHGGFDIENEYFLKLVESSYKILYPIMERIFQNQTDGEFYIKSLINNVDARGVFDGGKMYILAGSKVRKEVVVSYRGIKQRNDILNKKGIDNGDFYEIKEKIEFFSPSSASSFCLGNSSNGWDDWKNKRGNSMNEVLRGNQK